MTENPYEADLQLKMARNHLQLFEAVVEPRFLDFYAQIRDRTMLSIERLYDLYSSVQYVDAAGIPGAIVEIGTWKGGALGMALLTHAGSQRSVVGFDTFEGHARPADGELDVRGDDMQVRWDRAAAAGDTWAGADFDECQQFLTGLAENAAQVELVKGDVKVTGLDWEPKPISILRIDCDWYLESLAALEIFWPHLAMGGVVILDDFGHHLGQRRAVEEFFHDRPMKLTHVDYSCLSGVKTCD